MRWIVTNISKLLVLHLLLFYGKPFNSRNIRKHIGSYDTLSLKRFVLSLFRNILGLPTRLWTQSFAIWKHSIAQSMWYFAKLPWLWTIVYAIQVRRERKMYKYAYVKCMSPFFISYHIKSICRWLFERNAPEKNVLCTFCHLSICTISYLQV